MGDSGAVPRRRRRRETLRTRCCGSIEHCGPPDSVSTASSGTTRHSEDPIDSQGASAKRSNSASADSAKDRLVWEILVKTISELKNETLPNSSHLLPPHPVRCRWGAQKHCTVWRLPVFNTDTPTCTKRFRTPTAPGDRPWVVHIKRDFFS